jgi:hypothetical protein
MTRLVPAVLCAAALAAAAGAIFPAQAGPMGAAGGPAIGAARGPGPAFRPPAAVWNQQGWTRGRQAGPRAGLWVRSHPRAAWGRGWGNRYGWGWGNRYGYGWGSPGWYGGAWTSAGIVDTPPASVLPPLPDPGPPQLPVGGVLPSPVGAPVLFVIDDRSNGRYRRSGGAPVVSAEKPVPLPGGVATSMGQRPKMITLIAQ